jgi:choloylglycine hydrolase
MRDPQNLRVYYTSFDDQTIRMIDMKRFDLDANEIMRLPTGSGTQPVVGMSGKFQVRKTGESAH